MKLTIAAVGRLKSGPEQSLIDDYLKRAGAAGRGLALGPVTVTEIDERKAQGRAAQSTRLLACIPGAGTAVALDERGDTLTSPEFAKLIARERDGGCPEMVFLIGGADGLDEAARATTGYRLSFGPMVWPHMLARVMLSEQIYRAVSILAGSPYHRV
ncbi:MAG: 23S rRNA (pseudouridine(1915)-N(3))-methyltransferase RlmH [Pseudomonadota bacterium]